MNGRKGGLAGANRETDEQQLRVLMRRALEYPTFSDKDVSIYTSY